MYVCPTESLFLCHGRRFPEPRVCYIKSNGPSGRVMTNKSLWPACLPASTATTLDPSIKQNAPTGRAPCQSGSPRDMITYPWMRLTTTTKNQDTQAPFFALMSSRPAYIHPSPRGAQGPGGFVCLGRRSRLSRV